ncbi:hypothetical protein QAD02_012875 [Eretmocerus hayati]|uniref:Uncharacterized protein n=1 Tax=Eretmocerus hayati TaxID=131215 RepID=A0ACC2P1W0_9HYME|nr:hypothetical protein QAD02_012875 [Eretmocerus hayati]
MTIMAGEDQEQSHSEQNDVNTFPPNQLVDRIKTLYPMVDEDLTPLPRAWSSKDKYNYIGLSQNNLRVHYKASKMGQCTCYGNILYGWHPYSVFLFHPSNSRSGYKQAPMFLKY